MTSGVKEAADGLEEVVGGCGFLEEVLAFAEGAFASGVFAAVTAGEESAERRLTGLQGVGQLKSAEAFRHHDVRQQEVNGLLVVFPKAQGFKAVGGVEHVVAGAFENGAGKEADGRLIFDQKNCFAATPGAVRLGLANDWRRHGAVGSGKADLESGALVGWAQDLDKAAVLFDDAEDGGEAEAGSLAWLFGGEEGLEDVRENLRRNA